MPDQVAVLGGGRSVRAGDRSDARARVQALVSTTAPQQQTQWRESLALAETITKLLVHVHSRGDHHENQIGVTPSLSLEHLIMLADWFAAVC